MPDDGYSAACSRQVRASYVHPLGELLPLGPRPYLSQLSCLLAAPRSRPCASSDPKKDLFFCSIRNPSPAQLDSIPVEPASSPTPDRGTTGTRQLTVPNNPKSLYPSAAIRAGMGLSVSEGWGTRAHLNLEHPIRGPIQRPRTNRSGAAAVPHGLMHTSLNEVGPRADSPAMNGQLCTHSGRVFFVFCFGASASSRQQTVNIARYEMSIAIRAIS